MSSEAELKRATDPFRRVLAVIDALPASHLCRTMPRHCGTFC